MKRILTVALGITMTFLLAGCSAEKPVPDPTSDPSMQTVNRVVIAPFDDRRTFIDDDTEQPEPVAELPEGYGYIADLSEDQAVDSGLAGCKVYADLRLDLSEREDAYLYQPVGESGEEWAYVRYVELKYGEI